MDLALRGNWISGITGFPHDLEVFTQMGLPTRAVRDSARL